MDTGSRVPGKTAGASREAETFYYGLVAGAKRRDGVGSQRARALVRTTRWNFGSEMLQKSELDEPASRRQIGKMRS